MVVDQLEDFRLALMKKAQIQEIEILPRDTFDASTTSCRIMVRKTATEIKTQVVKVFRTYDNVTYESNVTITKESNVIPLAFGDVSVGIFNKAMAQPTKLEVQDEHGVTQTPRDSGKLLACHSETQTTTHPHKFWNKFGRTPDKCKALYHTDTGINRDKWKIGFARMYGPGPDKAFTTTKIKDGKPFDFEMIGYISLVEPGIDLANRYRQVKVEGNTHAEQKTDAEEKIKWMSSKLFTFILSMYKVTNDTTKNDLGIMPFVKDISELNLTTDELKFLVSLGVIDK
jgi:hypothetical protein